MATNVEEWMLNFRTNIGSVFKSSEEDVNEFKSVLERAIDGIRKGVEAGRDECALFTEAIRKMVDSFGDKAPGLRSSVEILTEAFDPALVSKYHKQVMTVFGDIAGFEMGSLFNFVEEKALIVKEMKELKSIAAKGGAEFAKAVRYSSLPYIRGLWEAVEYLPNKSELESSIKQVISSIRDEDIPREFFSRLSDPEVLQWWMKEWGSNLKNVKSSELEAAFVKSLERGVRKGFFPAFGKQMQLQGKKIEGAFSKMMGGIRGQFGVLSVAFGTALSSTAGIITRSVTGVFDPLLEAISNLFEVALWPIQQSLYELFYEVQPYILKFSQVLGRIVFQSLPVFKVLLSVLQPSFIVLSKSISVLESVLVPVFELFDVLSSILSGKLLPTTGIFGKVVTRVAEGLSKFKFILDLLGWVLAGVVLPLLIYYSAVLVKKVYASIIQVVVGQWKLIRSLIVSGAQWAFNRKLIGENTLELIKNFKIGKLLSEFTLGKMLSGMRALWRALVGERLERLKNTIGIEKETAAKKMAAAADATSAAQSGKAAKAIDEKTKATSKAALAIGAMTTAISIASVWGAEWSSWTDVLTNSLILLLGVLPLLTATIGKMTVAQWLWTGAVAAFNFIMSMNPITWIILSVVALIAGIALLVKWIYGSSPGLIPGLELVGNLFVWVFKVVVAPIRFVISLFKWWVEAIFDVFSAFGSVMNQAGRALNVVGSAIKSLFSPLSLITTGFQALFDSIQAIYNWVISNWSKISTVLLVALGPLGWGILLIKYLINNWSKLKQSVVIGSKYIVSAIRFVLTPINWVISGFKYLLSDIQAVYNWIVSNWPKISTVLLVALGPLGWGILLIKYLVNNWDNLKKSVASGAKFIASTLKFILMPIDWITSGFKYLLSNIQIVYDWVVSNWPKISTALLIALGPLGWGILLVEYLVENWDKLKLSVVSGAKYISSAIGFVLTPINWVISGFKNLLSNIQAVYNWIVINWSKVSTVLLIALGPIGWGILLVKYLMDNWDKLKQSISSGAKSIAGTLKFILVPIDWIASGFKYLLSDIQAVYNWIVSNWPKISTVLLIALGPIGWGILLVKYLINNWDKLKQSIASGAKSIAGTLKFILVPIDWIASGFKYLLKGIQIVYDWVVSNWSKVSTVLLVALGPIGWGILLVKYLINNWDKLKQSIVSGSRYVIRAIGFIFTPVNWVVSGFKYLLGVIQGVYDWVVSNWSKISKVLLEALSPLEWGIFLFKSIKDSWNKIKDSIVSGVNSITKAFFGIWDKIRDKFNSIVKWFIDKVKWIPRPIRYIMGLGGSLEEVEPAEIDKSAIKEDIAETGSTIEKELGKMDSLSQKVVGVEVSGTDQIDSAVRDWQQQGKASGEAVAKSFAEGQVENVGRVAQATEEVAQTASDYLPHSDAKTGPLSKISSSGAALPETFAEGAYRNKDTLGDMINKLFSPLVSLIPAPIRSLVLPKTEEVDVGFELETELEPVGISDPIVAAIDDQTAKIIEFLEEYTRRAKDLDVSELENLSRFGYA